MSIHSITAPDPIQSGDIIARRKLSGLGWHYGTGLSDGNIAHTSPATGKTVVTPFEFSAGLPIFVQRPVRTPQQKAVVELRALSNVGRPYDAANGNCEHDMTMAQFGIAQSPTANSIKILTLVSGGLLLLNFFGEN